MRTRLCRHTQYVLVLILALVLILSTIAQTISKVIIFLGKYRTLKIIYLAHQIKVTLSLMYERVVCVTINSCSL